MMNDRNKGKNSSSGLLKEVHTNGDKKSGRDDKLKTGKKTIISIISDTNLLPL